MRNSFKALALASALALVSLGSVAEADYAKRGVRLLSNVPLSAFQGSPWSGSAVLGYTSPSGREYAIMGASNGKHFFDITDPTSPINVGFVSTMPAESLWQEMAVLGNYCYGVSEGNFWTGQYSALQIIDLSNIDLGVVSLANTWSDSFVGTNGNTYSYRRSHTAQANPRSNTVYLNGSGLYDRRYLVALDASNPTNPVVSGYWRFPYPSHNGVGVVYVHDSVIVNYDEGPYAGKEIAFLCTGYDGLWILDVTDKANMTLLGKSEYINNSSGVVSYCHSGSLSPDKKYFYVRDEFDEGHSLFDTSTTHVIDIQDLSNPTYVGPVSHPGQNFIDHNSIVQDGHLLVASYAGGVRIFSLEDSTEPVEVGFFDSYPEADYMDYVGNWGVDGNFRSGNIILSDMQHGLYVLDPTEALGFGAVPVAKSELRATVTGSFNDSRRPDDRYLRLEGQPSGMLAGLTLETTNLPATGAGSFSFEGRAAHLGTRLAVWVKNQTSGDWVLLGEWKLGTTDETNSVPIADVAPYVDSSNRIELRLQAKGPVAKGSSGTEGPTVLLDALNFRIP